MINVQLSFITLASTLPVRAKRWKAYAFRCVQFIWNSSTIHTCGSACRVYLELLWWCNIFSNKGCKFVVSAGTSCTVVQEEFLMLLMIMFPKAWLVLLLIPPALTIYPDTFRKSTLHSPITPKNSILYVGWRTDFFKFITNPRFAVSLLKVVSSKVFPSIRKLSRYTNIPIYSLQRTETGIFTNFVNNVGAGLSPKRRQRYVQGILPFEIYILSWLFVQWNTKKGVFEVQLA